jgi:pimeloyl-ACP methyl ester carboxylesterase
MIIDRRPTSSAKLRTGDGVQLAATVRSVARPRGAVVLAHGFGGSQSQPQVVAVAEALRTAGFSVVTFDSRGHGGSEGLCTLGDLECLDVAAGVGLARSESDQVVLVGASMGAIAVLRHGASDPSLAAVVTVSCPAVWRVPRTARGALSVIVTQTGIGRRLAADRLGVRLAGGRVREAPPVALAARLARPLAVVHGEVDRFVPAGDARRLVQAAGGPHRLSLVPAMGHAYEPAAIPAVVSAVEWGVGWDAAYGVGPGIGARLAVLA